MSGKRIVGLATFTLLFSTVCGAQDPSPNPSADINTLRQQLEEQSTTLMEQQRRLNAELKNLESQKRTLDETRRRLEALRAQMGLPAEPKPQTQVQQTEVTNTSIRGEETRTSSNSLDVATVFDQPGILTPRGKVVLEPSLQYSFVDTNQVSIIGYSILPALVIGLIDVRHVSQSNLVAAITGRYGLTNRLEIEAKIPYLYRTQDTISRPIDLSGSASDQSFGASGNGLGDIELAARYQLNEPKGDDPFYVAGLRFKTTTGTGPFDVPYIQVTTVGNNGALQQELPTGSGFYSLQGSLSGVLPSDPAVFFGGVNYLINFKRNVNKNIGGTFIGEVDPGDSAGINFGMGLSINEKSAFSLGYEHTWIGKTKTNGITPPVSTSTQLASLTLGFSYRLNKTTNLNLSVGAGLTSDTPSTTITLRVPMTF